MFIGIFTPSSDNNFENKTYGRQISTCYICNYIYINNIIHFPWKQMISYDSKPPNISSHLKLHHAPQQLKPFASPKKLETPADISTS